MAEEEVPPGWSCFVDEKSQVPYYVHETTGETSWDLPDTGTVTMDTGYSSNSHSSSLPTTVTATHTTLSSSRSVVATCGPTTQADEVHRDGTTKPAPVLVPLQMESLPVETLTVPDMEFETRPRPCTLLVDASSAIKLRAASEGLDSTGRRVVVVWPWRFFECVLRYEWVVLVLTTLTVVVVAWVTNELRSGMSWRLWLSLSLWFPMWCFALRALVSMLDKHLFLLVCQSFDFVVISVSVLFAIQVNVVRLASQGVVGTPLAVVMSVVWTPLIWACMTYLAVVDASPGLSRRIRLLIIITGFAYLAYAFVQSTLLTQSTYDEVWCTQVADTQRCTSAYKLRRAAWGNVVVFTGRLLVRLWRYPNTFIFIHVNVSLKLLGEQSTQARSTVADKNNGSGDRVLHVHQSPQGSSESQLAPLSPAEPIYNICTDTSLDTVVPQSLEAVWSQRGTCTERMLSSRRAHFVYYTAGALGVTSVGAMSAAENSDNAPLQWALFMYWIVCFGFVMRLLMALSDRKLLVLVLATFDSFVIALTLFACVQINHVRAWSQGDLGTGFFVVLLLVHGPLLVVVTMGILTLVDTAPQIPHRLRLVGIAFFWMYMVYAVVSCVLRTGSHMDVSWCAKLGGHTQCTTAQTLRTMGFVNVLLFATKLFVRQWLYPHRLMLVKANVGLTLSEEQVKETQL